ncbi:cytochrome P450 [Pilaira anomala]|nr:cytochrome P450 [Pilaira anomala]
MSLLENTFLHTPLQHVLKVYSQQVAPKLTKDNKFIAIGTAIALSLVYLIQDRILKPRRNLRHIPYLSYLGTLRSMLRDESIWDRSHRLHLPLIETENSKGLFLESSRTGWVLQVANPEAAKHVLLKHDLFPKTALAHEYKDTLNSKFAMGPNILMLNGHSWKSQRKVTNPAFRRSVPIKLFGSLTQELFKSMETMDESVNFSDLMERWTLEVIGKAGFGFEFNAIHDRDSEWVTRYNKLSDALRDPLYFLFPVLDAKFRWLFPQRQKIHQEMKLFSNMLNKIIQHKKEMIKNGVKNDVLEDNERDLLSLMIESGKEGNEALSDEELMSNLCIFFLAGHDTTANALSFAIHYLAENQDIQEKARQEAITILGDEPYDILPTLEDTKKMKYINQIMKETLRINGPASRVVPRIASEDTVLSDTFIPKGTILTVNIFDIQHSSTIWNDPDTFNPDRFSEDGEGNRSAGEGWSWLPFGNGARQCIGMNFSLNEQRVMISMLLRKFTWTTPENSKHKNGLITGGVGIIGPADLDIAFRKRY